MYDTAQVVYLAVLVNVCIIKLQLYSYIVCLYMWHWHSCKINWHVCTVHQSVMWYAIYSFPTTTVLFTLNTMALPKLCQKHN